MKQKEKEKQDKKSSSKRKVTPSGEIYDDTTEEEQVVKEPTPKPTSTPAEESDEYKRGFQAALDMLKQQQQ